jgi:hypothetical protein
LFLIPAVDVPSARLTKDEFDEMRAEPNVSNTKKLLGILPVYVGMEMILTESYLPPKIVRGTPVTVVDIELHPQEPSIHSRTTITTQGCVLLHYMPKAIYVRLPDSKEEFLISASSAAQPGNTAPALPATSANLRGVIAAQPLRRDWKFKGKNMNAPISVQRIQCPLLPQKQCTLHGVQGKTADPGYYIPYLSMTCVHLTFS